MFDQTGAEKVSSRSTGDNQGDEKRRTPIEETRLYGGDTSHELTRHPTSRWNANRSTYQLPAELGGRENEERVAIRVTEVPFLVTKICLNEATRRVRRSPHLGAAP
jgi:hypothetical protein